MKIKTNTIIKKFILPCLLALNIPYDCMSASLYENMEAVYTEKPVAIDGGLEDAWDVAPEYILGRYSGGIDNLIVENYRTFTRLLWDKDNIYISFVCQDDSIVSKYKDRDDPIYEGEMCELIIDMPFSKFFLEVSVNPDGVVYDSLNHWENGNLVTDTKFNIKNLKWAAKTVDLGENRLVWTVEISIPWKTFENFSPETNKSLEGNFMRTERIRRDDLKKRNQNDACLQMSIFPTHVAGWPHGRCTWGKINLTKKQ